MGSISHSRKFLGFPFDHDSEGNDGQQVRICLWLRFIDAWLLETNKNDDSLLIQRFEDFFFSLFEKVVQT